jgi:hypothetical protein
VATQNLRAVKPGEPAPKQKRQNVAEAAESGDYRALLVATRDRIALTVSDPSCPPRDLAALTRRLTDIGREIEALDAREIEEGEGAGAGTPDDAWQAI